MPVVPRRFRFLIEIASANNIKARLNNSTVLACKGCKLEMENRALGTILQLWSLKKFEIFVFPYFSLLSALLGPLEMTRSNSGP